MSWRERFGLHSAPLPRGAAGESFFEGDPHYQRLTRVFAWLAAEPGIGVITGEPSVGKSSAMCHLCRALPECEHRLVYLRDCAVKPLDLYRMLAAELGLRPRPRGQLVRDIKQALVSLVDERGVVPIIILEDAQGLRDAEGVSDWASARGTCATCSARSRRSLVWSAGRTRASARCCRLSPRQRLRRVPAPAPDRRHV